MDLPESLKAALGTAGGGADAATAAVDTAVSSAVASASKLTAVAMESLNQRYEIGVAHATAAWWEVQALEDKVFEAPTTALASAIKDAPYVTAVAAEEEMSRGRSKLRQAAADLKRLVRDHPQIFSNLLRIGRPSRKRLTSLASNRPNLVTTTAHTGEHGVEG